jgi:CRISPR-associated protein Csm2
MANFQIDNLRPVWITTGMKSQEPINWAKRFGDYLGDKNLWDTNNNKIQEKDREGKPKTDSKGKPLYINSQLTTTKLRNFFGEVKRIQIRLGFENGFENETANILMLKPKLAYAVGKETDKNNQLKVKMFFEQFSMALDAIDVENPEEGKKHFKNFVQLMEAVVAYHKAKGGQ